MSLKHPTIWRFTHRNASGLIVWQQDWTENALADEGEQDILEGFFRGGTIPSNFYIGLINDATIAETDTLATMVGEPSANGYARQLTTFGATALDSGDYQTTSTQETFTASGGSIGPVDHAILTDVASGTAGSLIAYVPLSQSRTLADGDSLNVDITIKLA